MYFALEGIVIIVDDVIDDVTVDAVFAF